MPYLVSSDSLPWRWRKSRTESTVWYEALKTQIASGLPLEMLPVGGWLLGWRRHSLPRPPGQPSPLQEVREKIHQLSKGISASPNLAQDSWKPLNSPSGEARGCWDSRACQNRSVPAARVQTKSISKLKEKNPLASKTKPSIGWLPFAECVLSHGYLSTQECHLYFAQEESEADWAQGGKLSCSSSTNELQAL